MSEVMSGVKGHMSEVTGHMSEVMSEVKGHMSEVIQLFLVGQLKQQE